MARQREISFAGPPVRMEGFKQLVFHSWKLHNHVSNDEDADPQGEVDEGVLRHSKASVADDASSAVQQKDESCALLHIFYLIVNMMDEEDMMEDMMEDMVNMTDMMQDMMDMMNMMGLMDRYLMGRVSIGHVASLLSRLGMKLLAKDLGYRFVLKNPLYFSHICNSIICFKDL